MNGRLGQPDDERQDGANAQALADRGVEVFQSAQLIGAWRPAAGRLLDFVGDPFHDVGARHDLLQRPGQGHRGRVVAGEDQGHQGVADLLVAERVPVLVGRGQEIGQDALAAIRGRHVSAASR